MTQQFNNQHDDAQMPLGTGGDDAAPAEDYIESKPRINNSTVVLVGAFAAALAVLYLLGLQNKPRSASAEQAAIETELNNRISALLGDKNSQGKMDNFFDTTSRLLAKLRSFDNREGAAEIASNPFELDVPRLPSTGTPAPVVDIVRADPARAALLLQVAQDYKALKLEGVMLGGSPTALINKQMVNIGAKMGHLTVKDIQEGVVLLSFEDQVFRLEEKQR